MELVLWITASPNEIKLGASLMLIINFVLLMTNFNPTLHAKCGRGKKAGM